MSNRGTGTGTLVHSFGSINLSPMIPRDISFDDMSKRIFYFPIVEVWNIIITFIPVQVNLCPSRNPTTQ